MMILQFGKELFSNRVPGGEKFRLFYPRLTGWGLGQVIIHVKPKRSLIIEPQPLSSGSGCGCNGERTAVILVILSVVSHLKKSSCHDSSSIIMWMTIWLFSSAHKLVVPCLHQRKRVLNHLCGLLHTLPLFKQFTGNRIHTLRHQNLPFQNTVP